MNATQVIALIALLETFAFRTAAQVEPNGAGGLENRAKKKAFAEANLEMMRAQREK